jgi:hypothetical protein
MNNKKKNTDGDRGAALPPGKPSRRRLLNLGFVMLCAALLIFLYLAPEETTSPLPKDSIHEEFYAVKSKKEADAMCSACHSENGEFPLPPDHPDPYRCLFCHKRS